MRKRNDKYFFVCGLLMLFSELWKQYTLTFSINHGHYDWWYFPFQLCSLPMYLLLLLPFLSAFYRQVVHTFLMDYGLLCGIFVFFDISGMIYPRFSLTLHSFLWHLLLIGLGIFSGITQPEPPTRKFFYYASLLFFGGCFIATFLNHSLFLLGGLNMFYISPYYRMDQRVFTLVSKTFGDLTGTFAYILAIFLGAWLFHSLWNYIYVTKKELIHSTKSKC